MTIFYCLLGAIGVLCWRGVLLLVCMLIDTLLLFALYKLEVLNHNLFRSYTDTYFKRGCVVMTNVTGATLQRVFNTRQYLLKLINTLGA